MARALLARPEVTKVTWSPRTRSLTVQFEPCRQLGQVTANPLTGHSPGTTGTIAGADGFDWTRVLVACALAVLPVGPLGGLVIALISSLIEESQRGRHVFHPAPGPPEATTGPGHGVASPWSLRPGDAGSARAFAASA